jgi:hypothetical protein
MGSGGLTARFSQDWPAWFWRAIGDATNRSALDGAGRPRTIGRRFEGRNPSTACCGTSRPVLAVSPRWPRLVRVARRRVLRYGGSPPAQRQRGQPPGVGGAASAAAPRERARARPTPGVRTVPPISLADALGSAVLPVSVHASSYGQSRSAALRPGWGLGDRVPGGGKRHAGSDPGQDERRSVQALQ